VSNSNPKRWDLSDYDNWRPEDFPPGMIGLEGGIAAQYITGSWRSVRPVWTAASCKQCLLCWVNCPDSAILLENEQMAGIDYDHCKGCGICCTECRFEALHMQPERSAEVSATSATPTPAKG
jgi:pyruvate ferredoxin oxidoreductase delta subunit